MSSGRNSSLRRVIGPQRRFVPCREEQDEERSRLLSKIEAFYREACDLLSMEPRPTTFACFLDAGVCFGLLDPVSNVMANTFASSGQIPDLMVKAVDESKLREMGRRSLDGLVAFLIYFFPYLAGWEVVRYLLVADADLLVAARLIAADRGMMRFSVTSLASELAFKAALRLAAQVSGHPQPQRLADVWMSMSSQLRLALPYFSAKKPPFEGRRLVRAIRSFIRGQVDLGQSWDLAASRPPYSNIANMPYQSTQSLQMLLLHAIRGFYLRALAMLPRGELRSRYHRSLLKAGYCYGPMDPVSNIIINTIWYDVTFPAAEQPVLDMIGPDSIRRLESRSFYGLASFLQTRYHNLSEHEVVQCLVASCAYLPLADPNLNAAAAAVGDTNLPFADLSLAIITEEADWQQHQCRTSTPGIYDAVRKVEQQSPCTSAQEAYEAAAISAWHPNPEAHAEFLSSGKAMLQVIAFSLLQDGNQPSSKNVQYIASLLSPKEQPTPERIKDSSYPVIVGKMRSEAQQRRISRMVKSALDRHLLQDGDPNYELHIICGVNECVGEPESYDDENDAQSVDPCKFSYTHVNFFVTQKGSLSAEIYPILFFAEFDNEEEEGEPLLCCRVDVPTPFAELVRCLYCEARGAKIVHPASGKFHGGGKEFEEMICGGRPSFTNDQLICRSEYAVQHICGVEEDFMYVDTTASSARDDSFADDY